MPKYKQYSPILASNFEQKGPENTTSYNLQSLAQVWICTKYKHWHLTTVG